jgi:hypothetical protein
MPNKGFDLAYEAFTKMDSEMIPYLIGQLRYDRSGVIEKVLLLQRRIPIFAGFSKKIVIPTEHRSYAAVALGRMGPKAETAVPALLERWVHDNTSVKSNALASLYSILFNEELGPYSPEKQKLIEEKVISEAARRFHDAAAKLGIKPR